MQLGRSKEHFGLLSVIVDTSHKNDECVSLVFEIFKHSSFVEGCTRVGILGFSGPYNSNN